MLHTSLDNINPKEILVGYELSYFTAILLSFWQLLLETLEQSDLNCSMDKDPL